MIFFLLNIALGIIGNEFYQSEGEANLARGESITVANYTLTYDRLDMVQGPNYTELIAPMTVSRNGQVVGYTSVRRKPSRTRIAEVIPVYAQLLAEENAAP